MFSVGRGTFLKAEDYRPKWSLVCIKQNCKNK